MKSSVLVAVATGALAVIFVACARDQRPSQDPSLTNAEVEHWNNRVAVPASTVGVPPSGTMNGGGADAPSFAGAPALRTQPPASVARGDAGM